VDKTEGQPWLVAIKDATIADHFSQRDIFSNLRVETRQTPQGEAFFL
jgi:hypothetical protein